MPQFEQIASFPSQIFWLAVCFAIIYFSMSRIFLPRIRDILKTRNDQIDNNNLVAKKLEEQISKIEETNNNLKETSISQYKLSIDQSFKTAALEREKGLKDLKDKTFKMIEDSKKEITQFRKSSEDDLQKAVNKLVDEVDNKLINSTN